MRSQNALVCVPLTPICWLYVFSGEHFDIQEQKRLERSQRRQNTARLHVRIMARRPGIPNGEPARRTCHIAEAEELSNVGKGLRKLAVLCIRPHLAVLRCCEGWRKHGTHGARCHRHRHRRRHNSQFTMARQRNDKAPSAQLSNKPASHTLRFQKMSRVCVQAVPRFSRSAKPLGDGRNPGTGAHNIFHRS
jgi:hypothetical protein